MGTIIRRKIYYNIKAAQALLEETASTYLHLVVSSLNVYMF
jgi:hypothetical protein